MANALRVPAKRPQRLQRVLESHIQETFAAFLALDGWRRLRTDPVSNRGLGKGFGEVGMADDLFIRYTPCYERFGPCTNGDHWNQAASEVLWIEFKRVGGVASSAQKAWHQRERSRGALTIIVGEDCPATIEGCVEWYSKSGLQQRTLDTGSVRA